MVSTQPRNVGFNPTDFLRGELGEHRDAFEAMCAMVELPFAKTLQILEEGVRKGGKILFFGNGGSAADAQHIAAELVIRYKDDRIPIPAISITTNASVITACGNDLGYEAIFSRQVEALARPSDVAVGISTSGNSRNVLAGLTMARAKGARTIGLTGANGDNMQDLCDAVIAIPSTVTARIQEMHILIGHMWCKGLEQRLGLA